MAMEFSVENMKCGGCTSAVQQKLEALDGVDSVAVSLEGKSATVEGSVDPQQVIDTLNAAGYPASLKG